MDFRILGPLEVVANDGPIPVPRRRQRALLAVLILHAGEIVSTDRLFDDLWGERPPPTAREALQNLVSQSRRLLGAELLVTRAPGYGLAVEREQTDLGRFELLTAQARAAGDVATRAGRLREALALWRGPPLADLAFEPFAALELPHLNDLRLGAQQDLIDAELALGRHGEVIPELEALVGEHPFDERLRCRLAVALYRAGRQADGLDACRNGRRVLMEELALEPIEELRTIERQILRHDPVLDAPNTSRADTPPARKTVTVVCVGLADPLGTSDELDPERLRALLDRYAAALERHGGSIQELGGGEATAVFGLPQAHEDDALRAVNAAVDVRDGLGMREGEPALRIGVSTGEVYAAPSPAGLALATGAPVSDARRLAHAARAGEILLGAGTLRLVRGAVAIEPAEPLGDRPSFRLLGVTAGAPPFERHLDAPLVGRERELDALRDEFVAASTGPRCRVALVLGEAGIGKTRLAAELGESLRSEATVLVGRCDTHGEGAAYLPLAELVSGAGADLPELLAGAASTGEEFLAVRRFFESLARERPLVLVFEDVHWAEPTLLDLIEYLGERAVPVPLLVLCLARPELLDARPGWTPRLRLSPLGDADTRTLLEWLSAEAGPELRARIVELAEGNPLYAEQLLAHATEGGAVDALPSTLEALIASRLDRLAPGRRALLEQAAVVGRDFTSADLEALSPAPSVHSTEQNLAELERGGLVLRTSARGLRFEHVLIRDVAYGGVPKARRAELHERMADRLAEPAGGPDELVGYHLEQAYRYRTELGPPDAHWRRLAREAATLLGSAGIRAWKRGDTAAAVNLLERAISLAAEQEPSRLEWSCELGVALRGFGDLRRAEEVLAAAAQSATADGDRRAEARARLELANVLIFSDPGGRSEGLLTAAHAAIPVFEATGDERGLSRAWRLVAYVEGAMSCRYEASREAAERALDHSRLSGWSTAACLGDLAAALYYGPTPVVEAIDRYRALVEDADVGGRANVTRFLAALEAMTMRFGEARRHVEEAEDLYAEVGQAAFGRSTCRALRGEIELLAGDTIAAEEAFRASHETLEAMGDRAHRATRAAELAAVVQANGRRDEAETWILLSLELAAPDDVSTQFLWRSVRATLLAADGELAGAETLAREASALVETTDSLNQQGLITLRLAEILRLQGRTEEAAEAEAAAVAKLERKGNVAAVMRLRERPGP